MEILIFLIAISVSVATGFLISFIWAVKNGQFEDEYTPAMRMLFENTVKQENENQTFNKKPMKTNLPII